MVGGGVTGLAAAHALGRGGGIAVTLLERDDRVGGKVLTEHRDGVTFEAGADAFVAREAAILQLCDDLRLRSDLIAPDIFGAHIWTRDGMKRLPSDWAFGLPTTVSGLMGNDLVPLRARLRALGDLALPGRVAGEDISVGELVRRRFGGELLEQVVDPLLAGSRAGTADDISLAAAMPPLDAVARSSASIMRGLGAARREGKLSQGPPPFLGLPGGMQDFVDRLTESLQPATVRTGTEARHINPSGTGYEIELGNGEMVPADAVIVATPSFVAAELLEAHNPEAARHLYRIQYASAAVAILVYDGGSESLPASGSGFLVSSRDHRVLSACTWYSKKWAGTAPGDGRLVLRCFVGRAGREASLALDDEDLVGLMDAEVREAIGLEAPLVTWKVFRWDRGLPHYRVGHLRLLEQVDTAMASQPGIALAGAAYRGSGLPDCVRQGEEAAVRAINFVSSSPR
ncbi:MAG: protoporphyrinogen/coproporphyrinogen oxidase [Actinomycetota bacterium]|nr:protoporphyrinogen/coproporphyrinogen oxidase [Actinomycetota bacterium]